MYRRSNIAKFSELPTARLFGDGSVSLSCAIACFDPDAQSDHAGDDVPDQATESWVQFAYESTWKGHRAGKFVFNEKKFADAVSNFKRWNQELAVTFGHPDHEAGNPVPAAGWIKDMAVRKGQAGRAELWGLVAWTPRAARGIRNKEYKYCSIVANFSPIDRETGKPSGELAIVELGLTGSPFIPGMQAISLSLVGSHPIAPVHPTIGRFSTMDEKKILAQVAKLFGLPPDATPEQMRGVFEAILVLMAAKAGKPVDGEIEVETAEEVAASANTRAGKARIKAINTMVARFADVMGNEVDPAAVETQAAANAILTKLMDATSMDAATTLAAVTEHLDQVAAVLVAEPVAPLSAGAGKPASTGGAATAQLSAYQGRTKALEAQLVKLSADLVTLTAEREERLALDATARHEAAFSDLLTSGRVIEGQRAQFMAGVAKDEELTLSIYQGFESIVPPTGQIATGNRAAPLAPSAGHEPAATGAIAMFEAMADQLGFAVGSKQRVDFINNAKATHQNTH